MSETPDHKALIDLTTGVLDGGNDTLVILGESRKYALLTPGNDNQLPITNIRNLTIVGNHYSFWKRIRLAFALITYTEKRYAQGVIADTSRKGTAAEVNSEEEG